MNEWQEAGKPIRSFGTMSVTELKEKLKGRDVLLLDVRDPSEWVEDGYIQDANLIFFADLAEKADSLPKDKPIAGDLFGWQTLQHWRKHTREEGL